MTPRTSGSASASGRGGEQGALRGASEIQRALPRAHLLRTRAVRYEGLPQGKRLPLVRRHDGRPKPRWIEIDEELYEDELAYLRSEIYGWPEAEPLTLRLTATDRFRKG